MLKTRYNIIYADPPWTFGDRCRAQKGKKEWYTLETMKLNSYKTLSDKMIKNLNIKEITADNAILFLWTTDAHLPIALEVMKAWGFIYKTIGFIWNKKTVLGNQVVLLGRWTMKGSEICLLGTKGKIHSSIKSHKVRQLVEAERRGHSEKPDEVRNRIVELMGDLPRIELFGRKKVDGWTVFGNEINGKDIREELFLLTNKNA